MSGISRLIRAYPTLLAVGFSEALAYRAEMLVWMLTTTMPLVSLALWSAVAEGGPVGRFDQRGFTSYFLATLVVRQLTSSWLIWQLNMEIKNGTLARRLLKPIHPLVAFSAENLSALPLRAALCAPIAIGAIVALGGPEGRPSAATWAMFALAVVCAWLLNFFAMAIVGALAFFLESSTAIFDVWLIGFMTLSGYLVPLELFPEAVRGAAQVLPFRYMVSFPVELAIGRIAGEAALVELAKVAAYDVLFGAVALLAWRAGTKRFASFGG